VSQLADVLTAKGSFSAGELLTVTGCVGGAEPPTTAANESDVVDRFSVGQPEHTARIVPLIPTVVESPLNVLPVPGMYVPLLALLIRGTLGNAMGTAAGMVPPLNATVDANAVFPALKVQLLTLTVSLPLPGAPTVTVALQVNWIPPAENVMGRFEYTVVAPP
jgi:hypothetical protein